MNIIRWFLDKVKEHTKCADARSHTITVHMTSGEKLPLVGHGNTLWEAIQSILPQIPNQDWLEVVIGYKMVYHLSKVAVDRHILTNTQPIFQTFDDRFIS